LFFFNIERRFDLFEKRLRINFENFWKFWDLVREIRFSELKALFGFFEKAAESSFTNFLPGLRAKNP
jgi:hypothetical protein